MRAIPANFRELARERSGTSILDSGGAYGYQWQRPPIPEDFPLHYVSGRAYPMLCISTAQALEDCFEIDRKLTEHFYRWAERVSPTNGRDVRTWFDLGHEYIERMAAKGRCGENAEDTAEFNTYNWDTDLDQVVQITAAGLYSDLVIIHMHTGADVRGGYATPVVARAVEGMMGAGLEGFLSQDQIDLYCSRCDLMAENLYRADESGWRLRMHKRSASYICPKCHHAAVNFPMDPLELEREAAVKQAS